MDTTTLDEIWNRACMDDGGSAPLKGDIALANMIYGHGYIMNGGLDHFLDMVDEERLDAIEGYRYFGFHEVILLLQSISRMTEVELESACSKYVSIDDEMISVFRAKTVDYPDDFAPL